MFLEYYNLMVEFLEANAILIALLMTLVQYLKPLLQQFVWYKGWMVTVGAFVLSFLLAIPENGFVGIDVALYIVQSIGLGLVATGIYKVGEGLAYKAMSIIITRAAVPEPGEAEIV